MTSVSTCSRCDCQSALIRSHSVLTQLSLSRKVYHRTDTQLTAAAAAAATSGVRISHTHMHTCLTALFSGTTRASRYLKGKTNLDFTEAKDSEWQWHQMGHVQVCTSHQHPTTRSFTRWMPFLPTHTHIHTRLTALFPGLRG